MVVASLLNVTTFFILTMNVLTNTYREQSTLIGNFQSPFLSEVKDPYALNFTFNKLPIIPFYGNSSDSSDIVLNLIYRLYESTPIVAGVIDVLNSFTVGAGMTLEKGDGLGIINKKRVQSSDDDITNFEKLFFDNFIDTDLDSIISLSSKSLHLEGNSVLCVSIDKLSKKIKIEKIETTKFRYHSKYLYEGEKLGILSNYFSWHYLQQTPPTVVPVYPNFEEKDGVLRTLIHVKNTSPNRKFYGLSNGASSLLQQYLLNQLDIYLSGSTENRFIGSVFFDIPVSQSDLEGDGEDRMKRFIENQKNTVTNKGSNKSTIMNFFNTFDDGRKVNITQFQSNQEHDFFESISKLAEDKIFKAFGVNKALIGDTSDAGLFGERLDVVYQGQAQKVKVVQKIIENSLNTAFDFIEEHTQVNYRNDAKLRLKNLFQEMKKDDNVSRGTLEEKQENGTDNTR